MPAANALKTKQLQIIHVALAKLGIDDTTYRTILDCRYEKTSAKDLTSAQRTDLINHLIAKGFRITGKKWPRVKRTPVAPNVIEIMTRQQAMTILHLTEDIGFTHTGFQTFLKKRFHLDRIKTKAEASKVIQALKNMRDRSQGSKRYGQR